MKSMPIKEYIILKDRCLVDLEIIVKEHLRHRWIPQGGLVVTPSLYYQAMIKYLCNHHSTQVGDEWICVKCGEHAYLSNRTRNI